MTLCFFWIPIIELLYAIAFIISVIFNFIVDCWWVTNRCTILYY